MNNSEAKILIADSKLIHVAKEAANNAPVVEVTHFGCYELVSKIILNCTGLIPIGNILCQNIWKSGARIFYWLPDLSRMGHDIP